MCFIFYFLLCDTFVFELRHISYCRPLLANNEIIKKYAFSHIHLDLSLCLRNLPVSGLCTGNNIIALFVNEFTHIPELIFHPLFKPPIFNPVYADLTELLIRIRLQVPHR